MRRAQTLVELLIVVAIIALAMGIVAPPASRFLDGVHVRGAATEARTLLALARHVAVRRSTRAAIRLDPTSAAISVHVGPDTVASRSFGARGVALHTTRDSLAYGPTGRGYGASTATIILARGQRAETLFVSRLGRVR